MDAGWDEGAIRRPSTELLDARMMIRYPMNNAATAPQP